MCFKLFLPSVSHITYSAMLKLSTLFADCDVGCEHRRQIAPYASRLSPLLFKFIESAFLVRIKPNFILIGYEDGVTVRR